MDKIIGLYKITSPSGKIYIGQSFDIERRWKDHKSEVRMCRQGRLGLSFKKHGYENHKFDILIELPPDILQQTLDIYEAIYIKQFIDCGFYLLNMTDGGGAFGKHNEATIQKLRIANKGQIPWNKGKTNVYTEDAQNRRSQTLMGHKMQPHVKEILLQANLGNKNRLGKKHSQQTKDKISRTKRSKNEV